MKQYTEQENRERKMFGETVEEMKQMAGWNYREGNIDPLMVTIYAMGILSDAQHVLAEGIEMNGIKPEEIARLWMNKAKWFLSEVTRELHPQTKLDRQAEKAKKEVDEYNARRDAARETLGAIPNWQDRHLAQNNAIAEKMAEEIPVEALNAALNAELKRRQEERNK